MVWNLNACHRTRNRESEVITEYSAGKPLRCARSDRNCHADVQRPQGIYHLSRGTQAIPLAALLDLGTEKFSAIHPSWRSGQILPPVLAPRAAFDDFRLSIAQSRDFLFNQVLESVDSFLPELFYPKQYQTRQAELVFGGALPFPDWRPWIGQVIDSALASDFGRKEITPSLSR